ncbi:hypothetical protein ACVIQT_000502 [Bradyrhizobium diazoefficiens]
MASVNGADSSQLTVHMHARDLAERSDLAGLGVRHVVPEADRLVANLEQVAADLDDVAGQQLTLVGDVLLHGGHAATRAAQVARRQPKAGEQIPVGLVEFADIPHDVHVADMIALPRIDRAAIGCLLLHRNFSLRFSAP